MDARTANVTTDHAAWVMRMVVKLQSGGHDQDRAFMMGVVTSLQWAAENPDRVQDALWDLVNALDDLQFTALEISAWDFLDRS